MYLFVLCHICVCLLYCIYTGTHAYMRAHRGAMTKSMTRQPILKISTAAKTTNCNIHHFTRSAWSTSWVTQRHISTAPTFSLINYGRVALTAHPPKCKRISSKAAS